MRIVGTLGWRNDHSSSRTSVAQNGPNGFTDFNALNAYTDWTDPTLRNWLEKDLASAQKAQWRFVAYHHPDFQSAETHRNDQWMRVTNEIFRKHQVDIVFCGHVHNYQRTFPMTYSPATKEWKLDKEYNGSTKTHPKGVIYLVTGAGGAGLYNPEQQDKPEKAKP